MLDTRALFVGLTALALPVLVHAGSTKSPPLRDPDKFFIGSAYAKRLVKQAVERLGQGSYPWRVELKAGPLPTVRTFRAFVKWSKDMPHKMVAVRNYTGTINVQKGIAEKGSARVRFTP